MAQRRHHYELAFEEYLRARLIPYVAVDEARKALLPARPRLAFGPPAADPTGLKSFDFVLYDDRENLLVDVKGRRVARRGASSHLDSWVTRDDVDALRTWEGLFGAGFAAAFVFIYWCDEQPPGALFEEIFEFRGLWYAIRAIRVADYAPVMRVRSPRWGTVHLPSRLFDALSGPLWRPLATAV